MNKSIQFDWRLKKYRSVPSRPNGDPMEPIIGLFLQLVPANFTPVPNFSENWSSDTQIRQAHFTFLAIP